MNIPDDVLPEDKMIDVMTDMHIVEGAKMGRNMMGDTLKAEIYFDKIYEKHQTSKEEYDRSFSFYTKHPGTMDKIYEQVIENLNSIEIAAPKWEDKSDSLSSEKMDTAQSDTGKDLSSGVKLLKGRSTSSNINK